MRDDDYRDYDEGNGSAVAVALVWILLVAAFIGAAVMLSGCSQTKYVPVETVRTEYKDKIREVHTTDSVVDTRFLFVKGDTVIDYRDRIKWRDRFVHDTVNVVLTDSVPVPYPVEKKLSPWQQTKQDYGGWALITVAVMLLAAVVWLAKKFRRNN